MNIWEIVVDLCVDIGGFLYSQGQVELDGVAKNTCGVLATKIADSHPIEKINQSGSGTFISTSDEPLPISSVVSTTGRVNSGRLRNRYQKFSKLKSPNLEFQSFGLYLMTSIRYSKGIKTTNTSFQATLSHTISLSSSSPLTKD